MLTSANESLNVSFYLEIRPNVPPDFHYPSSIDV